MQPVRPTNRYTVGLSKPKALRAPMQVNMQLFGRVDRADESCNRFQKAATYQDCLKHFCLVLKMLHSMFHLEFSKLECSTETVSLANRLRPEAVFTLSAVFIV